MSDTSSQKVAVITGFYQSPRFLITLFDFLNRQSFKNFHVFVYNYSYDYIESLKENTYSFNYTILKLDKNIGFAGGNNYAIQEAKKNDDYDFYALINDDTKPDENWLANLVAIAATDSSIGAVASKMLYYEPFIIVQGTTKPLVDKAKNKPGLKFYENSGFENCYYTKKFYLNGFQQENEDEIYAFRYIDENFSLGIPVSLKKTGDEYKLKMFVRKSSLVKEQQLFLSIGETEIAAISLKEDQICYPFDIPASVINNAAAYIIQNAGSDYDKGFNGYDRGSGELDKGQYDEVQEVNMFCGGACLLTKKALHETGLFNSHFFSYYEDSDLSLRLKRKGFKIIYNPAAVAFHHHSGSGKEWSPFFTYHVFRNKIIFSAKNFGWKGFLLSFKERLQETWLFLKWAAKSRFKDHKVKARLKLNYYILKDALIGIIKYKPIKF